MSPEQRITVRMRAEHAASFRAGTNAWRCSCGRGSNDTKWISDLFPEGYTAHLREARQRIAAEEYGRSR